MIEKIKNLIRGPYHYALQALAAVQSGLPARSMTVIGIGGTKGKSTVSEMVFAILSEAGITSALVGTIRFAVGKESKPNKLKMTMPGRGFIQRFLARAKRKGATHAIVELTTEGARQYRNLFLYPDIILMTNVQKEHIESHGSFEKYVERKWDIVRELERSPKPHRAIVAGCDDEWNTCFIDAKVPVSISYSKHDIPDVKSTDTETTFTYKGKLVTIPLPGVFNAVNALGAIKIAEHLGIPLDTTLTALKKLAPVLGRVERIEAGQDFLAVVDYAHTPDSLRALYDAFPHKRKICVLGNTGGGRDTWKRPEMGAIADSMCDTVILTNEDPYDENPEQIVQAMAKGMKRSPLIIMDRRAAIREALSKARAGDVVLVSGKGTDPYIMGPKGAKTLWSDATVVREEIEKLLKKN